jgi:hypothetical protein
LREPKQIACCSRTEIKIRHAGPCPGQQEEKQEHTQNQAAQNPLELGTRPKRKTMLAKVVVGEYSRTRPANHGKLESHEKEIAGCCLARADQLKTQSLAHGQKRRVPRRTKTGNRNLLVVVEKSIWCVDQWNRKHDRTTTPHDGILEQKIG